MSDADLPSFNESGGIKTDEMSPEAEMETVVYDIDDARFRIKPYQQIVSSCTGAFVTSMSMTPLDVIKTRLQTQQKTMLSNKCFVYCNGLMDHLCPCAPSGDGIASAVPPSRSASSSAAAAASPIPTRQNIRYNGTVDAAFKISRHEGVSALWSGLGPTLVLAIPATVIYFVCYEQLRVRIKDACNVRYPESTVVDSPYFIPLVAGMSARVISVSVVSPLELIRTKMQSQRLNYFQVGRAMQSMVAHEGIIGMWRGLGSTLCRDVPFSGIYWTAYESIKKWAGVQSQPGFWFSFGAGAASGSIAAFVTTPFDVVKTHKQIAFGERLYSSEALPAKPELTTRQMLSNIYSNNGFRGIFSGVTPRIVKIAPACAIMISSFEYGKAFFHKHNVAAYKNRSDGIEMPSTNIRLLAASVAGSDDSTTR